MADLDVPDLEYHVTFPTAISTEIGDGKSDNGAVLDRKEPVVILLGWTGCEDRNLSKYSAIYHSLGFTTVRYTAPRELILRPITAKLKVVARKVLELVFDLGLEENVVFFHVFSNGGCFIYRYITQYLHNPAFGGDELAHSIKVGGVVFDSAPCENSLSTIIRVRNNQDKTSGSFMCIIYSLLLILAAVFSFFLPASWSGNIFQDMRSFMSDMKSDRAQYPQLFLYSRADVICDWRKVDEVVEARRKRYVQVLQVCWEESAHCRHLLTYPAEYIQSCKDFVQECLLHFEGEEEYSESD